jgi:hypothetical protein
MIAPLVAAPLVIAPPVIAPPVTFPLMASDRIQWIGDQALFKLCSIV